MKYTKDPTPAEQEQAFAAEWAARNASLNGRHDPNAPRNAEDCAGRVLAANGIKDGSARGTLYRAACTFPGTFGLSALVMVAWVKCPELFGLPGMEKLHPDSGRVRLALFGRRGLRPLGLVKRAGAGLYRVASPPG